MPEIIPNQPLQPVVPGATITPAQSQIDVNPDDDIHTTFSKAVASRDPEALKRLAFENKGTPVEEAANSAADTINKSRQEYNTIIKPIEDKGGLATPE